MDSARSLLFCKKVRSFVLQPTDGTSLEDTRNDFKIRVSHDDCGENVNERNCVDGIIIETQGNTIEIQGENGDNVIINGVDYSSSIETSPFLSRVVYVKQATSLFKLIRGFGFRVLYGYRRIYVSVDPFYDNKV